MSVSRPAPGPAVPPGAGRRLWWERVRRLRADGPLLLWMACARWRRLAVEPVAARRGMAWLVASFDRPLQLDALLRSMAREVRGVPPVTVLCRSSTPRFRAAYEEVGARHAGAGLPLRLRHETAFRADLLAWLEETEAGRVAVFVDDLVFRAPLAAADVETVDPLRVVFSLRLGEDVRWCQPMGVAEEPPRFRPAPRPDWRAWRWREGRFDWAFACALDGAILDRRELLAIARRLPFRAPNTLEEALQRVLPHFQRRGLCYARPRVVNLPLNRVQTDGGAFPHLGLGTVELLEAWERGLEMDLAGIAGLPVTSCFAEHAPRLVPRAP